MKIGFFGGMAIAAVLASNAFASDVVVSDTVELPATFAGATFVDQVNDHDKLAYCTGLVASSSVVMYLHGMVNNDMESIQTGTQGIQIASQMSDKVEEMAPDADHFTPADAGQKAAKEFLSNDREAFSNEMNHCGPLAAKLLGEE